MLYTSGRMLHRPAGCFECPAGCYKRPGGCFKNLVLKIIISLAMGHDFMACVFAYSKRAAHDVICFEFIFAIYWEFPFCEEN